MSVESYYQLAPSTQVLASERVVLILGGVTPINGADLVVPNRFAKNLRTWIARIRPLVQTVNSMRWCHEWPGTEGPWCLKLDVTLKRPLAQLYPLSARALEATDVLLVDRFGVRAFTITELGLLGHFFDAREAGL